jgi:hypothetical protein
MSDGGKGSAPRPFTVTQDEYADRFELIFGKKKKKLEGDGDEFRVSEGAALQENPPKASKGGEAS